MIYSGDEVGQVNDYSYKDDPEKRLDSRYIHRGTFQWNLVKNIGRPGTVQEQLFTALRRLETLRAEHEAFGTHAKAVTCESGDDGVLILKRTGGKETLVGIYNFSRERKETVWTEGGTDLLTGEKIGSEGKVWLRPHDFVWGILDREAAEHGNGSGQESGKTE